MDERKSARQVQEEIEHYAIEIADGQNIKLDYSINSIKKVEKVLSILYDAYKVTDDKTGMRGVAMEFGCYIVSVIERNFEPGEFNRDHDEYGDDTYPFDWRDKTIFPYIWCMKRLAEGPQDNVWSKFEALVLERKKTKSLLRKFIALFQGSGKLHK